MRLHRHRAIYNLRIMGYGCHLRIVVDIVCDGDRRRSLLRLIHYERIPCLSLRLTLPALVVQIPVE